MARARTVLLTLTAVAAVGSQRLGDTSPLMECDFAAPCDGFVTSLDNAYNTDKDVAWSRVSRLRTTTYRSLAGDTFLAAWRPARSGGGVTSRLLTADPRLEQPGCLQLRYRNANASLDVMLFNTELVIYTGTSYDSERINGISMAMIPLQAAGGPLMLVARLSNRQETEVGLDYVRFYRQLCEDVEAESGGAPTWGPPTTEVPATSEREQEANTPGGTAGRRLAAPLTLLTAAAAAALISC